MPYCLSRVFFRQNETSLCISKSFGYFSPSRFLRDKQNFKNRSATECPFCHVKRFRKFFAWAILLASKTRFLRKFIVFFPFCVILPLEQCQTVSKEVPTDAKGCLLQDRETFIILQFLGVEKMANKKRTFFPGFCEKISICKFCLILLLKRHKTGS